MIYSNSSFPFCSLHLLCTCPAYFSVNFYTQRRVKPLPRTCWLLLHCVSVRRKLQPSLMASMMGGDCLFGFINTSRDFDLRIVDRLKRVCAGTKLQASLVLHYSTLLVLLISDSDRCSLEAGRNSGRRYNFSPLSLYHLNRWPSAIRSNRPSTCLLLRYKPVKHLYIPANEGPHSGVLRPKASFDISLGMINIVYESSNQPHQAPPGQQTLCQVKPPPQAFLVTFSMEMRINQFIPQFVRGC